MMHLRDNPIAVSTWSLHHQLGYSYANGPTHALPFQRAATWGEGAIELLQLPAELAKRGYHRVEICHFHLASWQPHYLAELRAAFVEAGVTIQTLLIDDGDITNAETRERDLQWITQWIDAAAALGAEHARVIAGRTLPAAQSLAMSVAGLQQLSNYGQTLGVRIVTENWMDLLSTPEAVHHVLDQVGPLLGFMADTGNWHGPTKYDDLRAIFARAELCHAKANFLGEQKLDEDDFSQCLKAASDAHYTGPMALIFDAAGDEWQGLQCTRDFIERS